MSKGDRYVKLVEWSEEDGCFIGSCPELFYGGCHGPDAKSVFAELCEIIRELAPDGQAVACLRARPAGRGRVLSP